MAATISITINMSTTALAAAGGYCRSAISLDMASTTGALAAAHDFHHKEVPHHQRDHKDGAERYAGLGQGYHHLPDHLPGVGPRIHGCLNDRRVNAAMELKMGTIMNSVNRCT